MNRIKIYKIGTDMNTNNYPYGHEFKYFSIQLASYPYYIFIFFYFYHSKNIYNTSILNLFAFQRKCLFIF